MTCTTGHENFKDYVTEFNSSSWRSLFIARSIGSGGNVYLAGSTNNRINKITPDGTVSTIAGSGTAGFTDGQGTSAQFNTPTGVAVDSAGNVYVAESGNNRIRKITPGGTVSTLAGSGTAGYAEGTGTNAQFYYPYGIAVDSAGNVYVADTGNRRIRKITPGGTVSTLAGSGINGYADGPGSSAQFNTLYGIAVDSAGNVYVSEMLIHLIRKITPGGTVSTLAGGTGGRSSGTAGYADGKERMAQFNTPLGIAVDSAGNVYVADHRNNRIRKITPDGTVSTIAGNGSSGYNIGQNPNASFRPDSVAVDSAGNVYVVDGANDRIIKITRSGCFPICSACPGTCISRATGGTVNTSQTSLLSFVLYDLKTAVVYCSTTSQNSSMCSRDLRQLPIGPYNYGVDGTPGTCVSIGTSTRCFGGSGGSIRGSATTEHGGGDGLYIDFINSVSNNRNMSGKNGTGGGGGAGLYVSINDYIDPTWLSRSLNLGEQFFTIIYDDTFRSAAVQTTPGSGGSGIAILSYLSSEECPAVLPFYNFDLLSPVCTTCLQYNSSTPLFEESTGLCTSCPAATPYYDPSTTTCVSTCPAPMTPNPRFGNVCAIPPLTCQGARPYFNGYECAASQVNFSTQGGATGGNTVINDGSNVIHIFTTSGTFIPPIDKVLTGDILIVGGGGGGGRYSVESTVLPRSAGGGGGGDVRYLPNISFGQQSWPVTVGTGGGPTQNGGDSSFGTNVAAGGGAGSAYPDIVDAKNGASGGGGSGIGQIGYATAGFSGGDGEFVAGLGSAGGGGGGKSAPGSDGRISQGGNGGNGIANSITGTSTYYGGGGGGSAVTINKTYVADGLGGAGGLGGGGAGAGSVVYNYLNYQKTNMVRGENGIPNTGGGGGGGAAVASPGEGNYIGNPVTIPGSSGGSGIVIVRYSTTNLCPRDLPYFNPGLKTCTNCPDTAPQYIAGVCTACPGANQYWNGISCVAQCPSVLPRADNNKVCQLPCSGASPNWDQTGGTCVTTCPGTSPIAGANGVCGSCPAATPYWNPVTKTCVTGCTESRLNSVCTSCYDADSTRPHWNGSVCGPCPADRPAWTGPLTACQACPVTNPVWDTTSTPNQCRTCYAINTLRPFYNKTPGGYASSSSNRCQPCQISSAPSWNNTLKVCQTCIAATLVSTPYWSTATNTCTACPALIPYWNSRVCALPTNIITTPLTAPTTGNVTASATTSTSLPWKAFDGSSATSWQSNALYTANGPYNGNRSTGDSRDALWRGEFLQVEFQYSYIISSYTLSSSNLRRWAVLGSGDGFIWDLIDDKTTADTTNYSQTFYITPPLSNAYPLYRLVATKSSQTSVSVTEWSPQTANAAVTTQTTENKSALTVISGSIEGCDNVACVIDKSSSTDITDLVYGNYPATQIGAELLPDKAQEALSNCSSNVDCGFVQFDFLTNVSKFSSSAPYTVSTVTTTMSDVGLFQKKYGVSPPPRLRAPPGLEYSYYYIQGNRLGSNLKATIDVCGQACTTNLSCKGFNFYYTSSNCEFYSTISSSDKYDPNKGSFVRDSYIITGEQNTARVPYTNLDSSGSMCQNMTACNTDVSSLIGQLGSTIQSFSTAELDSCNYCPIRSVAKQGSVYTVSNEADIASNVAMTTTVQTKMRFSNVNTTTHIQLPDGNYTIRPYVAPTVTSQVEIRNKYRYIYYTSQTSYQGTQLWVGNEPFAAGIAPKNCFNSYVPGDMSISTFFPLYALGTTLKNSAGEVCRTTEKGTYISQTCTGSCLTGTDMDLGVTTAAPEKNTRGGGDPNLLMWEFIPVDWVNNGYYIRSIGSDKRIYGMGPSGIKYDAGFRQKPYLKWGSYIGKTRDVGYTDSDIFENLALAFVEGMAIGATLGAVSPDLVNKNDPTNIFFTSFPPQFNTYYGGGSPYRELQNLPSQGPGGSKYDDAEYIFVIQRV
jgi:sugar lactone lactonase YvrE